MDFLKELALPQSLEHYRLVILLATISALVFIPYISFVLGASTLSLWFGRKGRQDHDAAALRFSRTVIDLALFNKSLVLFLGIIPGASLVFSYAQVLHATSAAAAGIASVAFIFLAIGLVLLYVYRHSIQVDGLIEAFARRTGVEASAHAPEVTATNARLAQQSGQYGMLSLFFGVFLYVGSYTVAVDPAVWSHMTSLFDVFLSAVVWVRFLLFVGVALGVTGLGLLFFFLTWEGGIAAGDDGVAAIAKRTGRSWAVLGLMELPVLVLGSAALIPGSSVSGGLYGLLGTALAVLFLAGHFLYSNHVSGGQRDIANAFFVFLFGVTLLTVGDNVVLSNGTKTNAAILASVHERMLEELKIKLGVGAPPLSGEDIYNAKCSACHLFDVKKVGPPYFETIPKYADKRADLIAFILNPRKINPAYPAMPSQGLKAAEADSIASYIVRKVAAAGKMSAAPPQAASK